MREIEFRAKKLAENDWVYGDLVKNNELDYLIFNSQASYYDTFLVLKETIGQYTGVKDKNGKKIFEGDIVKGKFPYAEICVVVWSDKRCGFYLQPISKLGRASYDPYYKLNSAKLEIIGNIFDNGELLNED